MIPFAALCALAGTDKGLTEASLEALSVEGFTLRLPVGVAPSGHVELRDHSLRGTRVWRSGQPLPVVPCGGSNGLALWRITCDDADYRSFARNFMAESVRYTTLKTECAEAESAQALVGYDAAGDERFAADLNAQRALWCKGLCADVSWLDAIRGCEIGVRLDTPERMADWLTLDEASFRKRYYGAFGLGNHPLASLPFTRIHAGSPFCPELCADADMFAALNDRGTSVTLTLAPVPQSMLADTRRLIRALPEGTEVEVNDWGTAALVHEEGWLSLTLGPLLLRRRRDPRLPLMGYTDEQLQLMGTTAAQDPAFAVWLRDRLGVSRVTLEACGLPNDSSSFVQSVVMPFYQLNTAARCTLRAVCETGNRARQLPHGDCPRSCRKHCFLYPQTSCMVGIGNTVLGFDRQSLTNSAYLAGILRGTDRVIIDLV